VGSLLLQDQSLQEIDEDDQQVRGHRLRQKALRANPPCRGESTACKTTATFEQVALLLIDEQEHLTKQGERSERLNINDRQKLKKDILPYFGSRDVKTITYRDVNTDLNTVSADRGIWT